MASASETRSGAQVVTPYVIFYRVPEQTGAGWTELTDSEDQLHVISSRGAEQAIRDALKLNETLSKLANSSQGVEVLPVPMRSYKPVPVRLVPQDPIIKIGG